MNEGALFWMSETYEDQLDPAQFQRRLKQGSMQCLVIGQYYDIYRLVLRGCGNIFERVGFLQIRPSNRLQNKILKKSRTVEDLIIR
jgi:hypothetical protein